MNIDDIIAPQPGSAAPASPADPIASPGTAPVGPPAASSNLSLDKILNDGHAVDELTGEQIPLPLSGNTPETAMNKSVVSTMDRVNLSLGNVAGNINYLKTKFDDAKPIVDDHGVPSKDLAVLSKGTWYRVDPVNGDIQDPWERTKEYMKDAATYAPEALGIGVAAATDLVSGGTSIPASAAIAGATTAGIRTSLGRAVGTYDATPAEQAWDIGFETLLNVAGAKVLAGVKPTAKWVANKLPELASAFKDTVDPMIPGIAKKAGEAIADSPKAVFKKIFATYSVGENSFDTMLEHTNWTKSEMNRLADLSGKDLNRYHDLAVNSQSGEIASIANSTRKNLTMIYGKMRNDVLSQVPANFSANLDEPIYSAYSKAVENGLGKVTVEGKDLTGLAARQYLAEKGLYNAKFSLLSPEEISTSIRSGGALDNGLGLLAQDSEAHGLLKNYYDRLGSFVGGSNRTGPEGARAMLDFKKVAGDLSYDLSNTEAARAKPELKKLIDEGRTAVDDAVYQSLEKHGIGGKFLKLNSTYSGLSEEFQPLLQAKRRADRTDDPKVYEGLLNTFLSRPGKTTSARFAIDNAIAAAQANGLNSVADEMLKSKTRIQVLEAAKAFNPIKSGVLKADTMGAAQMGIGSYMLTHPDPRYAAVVAGLTFLRSPQSASLAIATTQGLSKGQQMLSQMSKSQLNNFLSSPQAINAFTTGVVQAPLVRAQAEQSIKQALAQKIQQDEAKVQQQQQQLQQQDETK